MFVRNSKLEILGEGRSFYKMYKFAATLKFFQISEMA